MTVQRLLSAACVAAFGVVVSVSSPALAGDWQVDMAQSRIAFTAQQSGAVFSGTIPAFMADISFDPAQLAAAKAVVVMPLQGINTGSSTRDEELPNKDWLDLKTHPEARFESTAFSVVDAATGKYEMKGTLTLRGVSQPVVVPFVYAPAVDGKSAKVEGQATLDRTAFGVGQGGWATDFSTVSRDIAVQISLVATRP